MNTPDTLDTPKTLDSPDTPQTLDTLDTLDTLEHRTPAGADRPEPTAAAPIAHPADSDGRPWPRRARPLISGLALVAVLGVAGTVAGFTTRDGDGSQDLATIQEQLEETLAERDAALADLDELEARNSILEARIGALQAERDRLVGELDGAQGDVASLEARVAELDATMRSVRAELTDAAAERDAALATTAALEADLTTAREQVAEAIAERNALAGRFPMNVQPSLDIEDVVGTYRVSWQEQFCSGLGSCGTPPKTSTATIRSTPEGYLRMELGTAVGSNLFRVPGGFHAVAGSTTVVPACEGIARPGTVTLTISPNSWTVARDGSVESRTWGGAATIEAPATGTCPAVLAVHGLLLTPTS